MPEFFIEKDLMNEVFKATFGHESEEKQAKLKSKAASLDTFLLARRRVEEIGKNIIRLLLKPFSIFGYMSLRSYFNLKYKSNFNITKI